MGSKWNQHRQTIWNQVYSLSKPVFRFTVNSRVSLNICLKSLATRYYFYMHRRKILCFNLKTTFFFQSLSSPLLGHQVGIFKGYGRMGKEGVLWCVYRNLPRCWIKGTWGCIDTSWTTVRRQEFVPMSATSWEGQQHQREEIPVPCRDQGTRLQAGWSTHRWLRRLLLWREALTVHCKEILLRRTAATKYSCLHRLEEQPKW